MEYSEIRLGEVTEENWPEVIALSVTDEQKKYLTSPLGILARGYVYRNCGARIWTIENMEKIIGLALVREFTDEPLGYDLQQFMIDKRYQGKGYGKKALGQILDILRTESKYDNVEVCVKRDDKAAIHVYEQAGFVDSGYVDESCPDSINMIYRF